LHLQEDMSFEVINRLLDSLVVEGVINCQDTKKTHTKNKVTHKIRLILTTRVTF